MEPCVADSHASTSLIATWNVEGNGLCKLGGVPVRLPETMEHL